jgi:hypothetical protein
MTELEKALGALGRELEIPGTPDLTSAVMRQLAPRRGQRLGRQWFTRPAALAIAFVIVAALAATLAIPDARSALFRVLHIGGEEIQFVDELPQVNPGYVVDVTLGRPVTLGAARREAHVPLRMVDEKPDRVYVDVNGTVWFLYGTPEHVRLLVAQTPKVHLDDVLMFKKLAAGGTKVEGVSIEGTQGYFLSGEPHDVMLVRPNGAIVSDSVRLARDVLIWSKGEVTYRLEGDFGKREALHLAQSLR